VNLMDLNHSRRQALRLIAGVGALGLAACTGRSGVGSLAHGAGDASDSGAAARLAALERVNGGRLGVSVLDTGSGATLGWRQDERFALCSTFKLLLAGLVLREIEARRIDDQEAIEFSAADLVPYAPVVEPALADGRTSMTALELARATQVTSDNVAANLLIDRLGGPAAVTAALRTLGDPVTRLDRREPELNLVPPGEVRDTTTPQAIARTTAALVAGEALSPASRERLAQWLVDTGTGLHRLRAGLPANWRAGDKTGTGIAAAMANKHNDVAVAWPPGRPALVIACFYEADDHYPKARAQDDAVLAQVGRVAADWAG
jgi:beta-lactamase class A